MISQNKPDREEVIGWIRLKLEAAQKRKERHRRTVATDERWEKEGKRFNPVYDRQAPKNHLAAASTEEALLSSALSLLTQQREDEKRLEKLCFELLDQHKFRYENAYGAEMPGWAVTMVEEAQQSAMASTSTTEEESV